VEVDVKEKPAMSGADSEFLDQLEDLKKEADAMGDNKLERQIDNTITYFTRQHIAKDTNESLELEEADDELEGNDMDLVRSLEAELMEGYSEFQRVGRGKKKTVAKNKGEEEVYGAGVKKGEEIEKKKLKNKTTMKESLEILKMKKLAGLLTEGEYAKALLREMEETTEGIKVEWAKDKLKDIFMTDKYYEKGLLDTSTMMGGKKVKEIVGYFEDENGEEDEETIGYVYSTSGDIDMISQDTLWDAFYNSLTSTKKSYRTGLKEMEEDVFDYSNLVLGTINRLIDMEEKGQSVLNILGRISEWNEVVDLAREEEGDSFDYSNLVLGTINQLINMGEKGQSVLNILGRISEWNEVVDLAREA
jgi:hypothetical protein